MKKTSIFLALICATFSACNNAAEKTETPTVADAPPAEPTQAPPALDSATKAQNWAEYMTPGENHKMLAAAEGKWATEMTMTVEGQPPMPPAKGTCEFKMALGGRYRTMTMKSDMGGMPFEGMGCIGYDNAKNMFVETWADNTGTGIMTMEGNYDSTSKTLEMKGKCIDGETRRERMYREVTKMIDNKNMKMEMYVTDPGGAERKAFELKYMRI